MVRGATAAGVIILSLVIVALKPASALGVFISQLSITMLLSNLATLGLDSYCMREISLRLSTHDRVGSMSLVLNAFGLSIIAGVLLCAGLNIVTQFDIPSLDSRILNNNIAIGISACGVTTTMISAATLRAMQKPDFAAAFDVGAVSLYAAVLIVCERLVHTDGKFEPIQIFAFAALLQGACGVALVALNLRSQSAENRHEGAAVSTHSPRWNMLRDYYLHTLISYSVNWGGTLAVSIMASTEQAGLYGLAQRITYILVFPSVIIAGVYMPQLAVMHASGNTNGFQSLTRRLTNLVVGCTAGLAVPLALCATWIMPIFGYTENVDVFVLGFHIASQMIAVSTGALGISLLVACGLPAIAYRTRLASGTIFIALTMPSIAIGEALGASAAFLAWSVVQGILCTRAVNSHLGVQSRFVFQ